MALGLLGLLAAISLNSYSGQIIFAKRVEAVLGLSQLWKAQLTYYANNGKYAATFQDLDFDVIGGRLVNPTTYKGNRYTYQLSQPWGLDSFYAMAFANLDGDPWPDILELIEVRQ